MKILINKLLLSITAVAALIAGQSPAMEKPYTFQLQSKLSDEELINENMVDETTKKILDENFNKSTSLWPYINSKQLPPNVEKEVRRFWGGAYSTRILDKHNLVFKPANENRNISRIEGAHIINKCAQDNNLLTVRAPVKKCYRDATGLLWIVAQRIKPSAKPFCLQQIKDIYKLAKLTHYCDLHAANIFNTQEGISFVIDTEKKSFADPDISEWVVPSLQDKFSSLSMEPEAQNWLNTKLSKLASKQLGRAVLDGLAIAELIEICKIA